jgi:hypothetical protein
MFKNIKSTHSKDITELSKFIALNKERVDIHIFSNAPNIWCDNVCSHMGLDTLVGKHLSKVTDVILKPNAKCYDCIEKHLYGYTKFIFVDDTMINFQPILNRPNWDKIIMSQVVQETPIQMRSDLHLVYNFTQVQQVLDTNN